MAGATMDKIVSLCKRRGFLFQGSELYGGLQGTWDYGPMGVELKNNVKRAWWRANVYERDDMEGLDAAILMNRLVLQVLRPRGDLLRPARRLPQVQEALPRRPGRSGREVPRRRRARPHRAAPVQPHVQDDGRAGRG